jgi:hypothetical protein
MSLQGSCKLPVVREDQDRKATAFNTALLFLMNGLTNAVAIAANPTNSPTNDELTMSQVTSAELSGYALSRNYVWQIIPGTMAKPFILIPPAANYRPMMIHNISGYPCRVSNQVIPHNGWGMFIDSPLALVNAQRLQLHGAIDCLVEGYLLAAPTASQVLARKYVPRSTAFITNDVFARIGVNPTAAATLHLKDDGVAFGQINITTSGVVTTTFSGTGTGQNMYQAAAGSVITVEAQVTPDATLANIDVVLRGLMVDRYST